MDAVTVIEEALMTGAAAAVKDQATAAVKAAVGGLVAVTRRVFGADPVGSTAVDKIESADTEQDAAPWRDTLRARLTALPEADLRELSAQAQQVLAELDPAGTQAGTYQVTWTQTNTASTGGMVFAVQGGTQHVTPPPPVPTPTPGSAGRAPA